MAIDVILPGFGDRRQPTPQIADPLPSFHRALNLISIKTRTVQRSYEGRHC